jgi:hypothetical protein
MRPGRAGLLAVVGALAFAGAAPASPAAAATPPPAGGIARSVEIQRGVDRAIERGVSWLRGRQADSGAFAGEGLPAAYPFGSTALSVHALRSCGASSGDPAVKAGISFLRKAWKAGMGRQTYEVSLALLALEALHAPGGAAAGARNIPSSDLDWIRDLAAWLVRAQTTEGGFGYHSPARGRGDLSNAQYALLGLKAARRCGVAVPKEVFRRALQHHLDRQEKDGPEVVRREGGGGERDEADGRYGGSRSRSAVRDRARGWGYTGPSGASGSMTSAGVSSVVICRGELLGKEGYGEKADEAAVRSIRDGLAWLGLNFSVSRNPGGGGWHYYYLYGLERAGVLAGVSWMASRDWYGEGAEYLVGAQDGSGAWRTDSRGGGRRGKRAGEDGDLLDTGFALLFLKKATFRVEGAVATEERDDLLDLSKADALDDDAFAATFDAVFSRWRRADGTRRGGLVVDFVRLGARAVPALIRRLEDPDEEARADALAALQRVTGQTHGYGASDPDEVRGRAVIAWEEWWFRHRARVVADADAGRFRF